MRAWVLFTDDPKLQQAGAYEVRRLTEVGAEKGIEISIYSPSQFDIVVTREDEQSIIVDGQNVPLPEIFLPRMGSGTTYFALSLIRQFERLNVLTTNSSRAIETVKDKLYTHQILVQNNLPIPKTMLAKYPVDVSFVEQYLGFPVVVKTLSGSLGKGVFLSENKQSFLDLMELIGQVNPTYNIIFQEFIAGSRGRDVRVIVVGGRVIGAMERIAGGDSFKANFSRGGSVKPFQVNREVEWLALESARLMGIDIAGVDLLFDGDGFKISEVNSSPGFKGIEECNDVNVAEEIFDYVRRRLGRSDRSRRPDLRAIVGGEGAG